MISFVLHIIQVGMVTDVSQCHSSGWQSTLPLKLTAQDKTHHQHPFRIVFFALMQLVQFQDHSHWPHFISIRATLHLNSSPQYVNMREVNRLYQ